MSKNHLYLFKWESSMRRPWYRVSIEERKKKKSVLQLRHAMVGGNKGGGYDG